ncbi:ATP-grasp fold amidoligase family protein [Lolliginicoccus levis]|uniref:ATP-grasp fold amidoligase family protein n=1 Tax=Lolliginicoccus levis TaxID=2919542 RepID=UPI00241C3055|nr:ATP-grasp fold amidoligase family protein [Lolliginicoccus levis]
MSLLQTSVATISRGILGALPPTGKRYYIYVMTHGRLPNLRQPRRYTEKITWRILNDKRDIWTWTCDKLAMKENVARRAGDAVRIPRTYWHGTDLRELATVELPEKWVLKPTHRSGLVHLGTGRPDIDMLIAHTRGWLDEVNWKYLGEWAYQFASRQFLVEERIGDGETVPDDVKITISGGRPTVIFTKAGRGGASSERFYGPDWTPLDLSTGDTPGEPLPRPANLGAMLDAAVRIAEGFDLLRVDLYNHGGELWFGETTPYSGSGTARYDPDEWDFILGDTWQLPDLDAGA